MAVKGIATPRGQALTREEKDRRLARVRAMLAAGCGTAQVMERFGLGKEQARDLMCKARAMNEKRSAGRDD